MQTETSAVFLEFSKPHIFS